MRSEQERTGFSQRLAQALAAAGHAGLGPTGLARSFNLRHRGGAVTVYAARKWLMGEAIPSQDKLRTLAAWLGVSPEWLRFGGEAGSAAGEAAGPAAVLVDPGLLGDLALLSEEHRQVVGDLVLSLLRLERAKKGARA